MADMKLTHEEGVGFLTALIYNFVKSFKKNR